ncbi:hypothetical protein K8354_03830 [Polaribacter litorisediminis]|uniref:hypothetical protein n=1 Tax=Polaribacter litorisediminis TaxID=1908341 RepID=UPI001CBFFEF9|nr:hypothetical protein [Polaribacter litorisediminis]UAM98960.1 hypothetical protein K8354_03830 [Polaribacter litorisediminis]
MQQDIREKLKDYKEENIELSSNHNKKFEKLLMQKMHQEKPKKSNFKWLSIAASVVLLVSLAIQLYPSKDREYTNELKDTETSSAQKEISLGSISPEFNTIETYYTNSINLAISELEVTENNKEVLEGYLNKIAELTQEYKLLTKELNTKGVNDDTIDALMSNLQLRLQLLQRLKKQLKQLNNLNKKHHETQVL